MAATDASDWVLGGREFSAQEIREILETVGWLPGLARRELAATVCEHLDWHTAAGTPKLQACHTLLGRLEAAGLVELPELRRRPLPTGKRAGVALSERTATDKPLAGPLRDFEPVCLEPVTETSQVGLWNEYVERFHPLGYKGAFGYRLRYFIRSGSQRLGCVLLAGAARAIAVRDRWIGWDKRARLRNLPRVVNNSRYLIFPHVQIPHLASHVLGQLARRQLGNDRCIPILSIRQILSRRAGGAGIDTFHYTRIGQVTLRDVISGPLRARFGVNEKLGSIWSNRIASNVFGD